MKILHVLPTRNKEYGGPVSVAEAMTEETNRQGLVCEIYPPRSYDIAIKSLRALWRSIRHSDVVHIHGLWNLNATVAAIIARWEGIPYVVTPHGMLDRWALAQSRFKKLVYGYLFEYRNLNRAAGVHFLNSEERDEAKSLNVRLKSFVLPNGVFIDHYGYLPEKKTLMKIYPELEDKVVILFLGRLHPKKGFDLLIPAFALAIQSCPRMHLLLAGPDQGGYRATLEEQIRELSMDSCVTFLGMVSGKLKLEVLASADFFVLPSHQEGDSVAVKEAMACRLPVLITPACHFPEVQETRAGMVVPPELHAWKEALISLYNDEDTRIQMGKKAWYLVHERYTWNKVVHQLIDEYRRLVLLPQKLKGRDA